MSCHHMTLGILQVRHWSIGSSLRMPKGDDVLVTGREKSGSSLMPWANVAKLAKERTLCAFLLLCGPLAPTPKPLHPVQNICYQVTSHTLLVGNFLSFTSACVSVCVSGCTLSLQTRLQVFQEQGTPLHSFALLLAQGWVPGRLRFSPVLASVVEQLLRVLPKSVKIPNPS